MTLLGGLVGAIATIGLVELVLILLAAMVIAGLLSQFGHPAFDNFPSRCPQCTAQGLVRLDNSPTFGPRRRLRMFRCSACGSSFREEIDGTLTKT